MDTIFHRPYISYTLYFIDTTFHGHIIEMTLQYRYVKLHFINAIFHKKLYFIDTTFHRRIISWKQHFIDTSFHGPPFYSHNISWKQHSKYRIFFIFYCYPSQDNYEIARRIWGSHQNGHCLWPFELECCSGVG